MLGLRDPGERRLGAPARAAICSVCTETRAAPDDRPGDCRVADARRCSSARCRIIGCWRALVAALVGGAVRIASRIDRSLADVDRRSMSAGRVQAPGAGRRRCARACGLAALLFGCFGDDGRPLRAVDAGRDADGRLGADDAAPRRWPRCCSPASPALAAVVSFAVARRVRLRRDRRSRFVGDRRVAARSRHRATYLAAQIAEAGVAEKDEVVSLLLREFEENEADWLWQIDTNRRVRSASPRFAFALGTRSRRDRRPAVHPADRRATPGRPASFPPSLHDLAERLKRRESFSNLLVQVEIGRGPPLVGAVGHADARRERQLHRLPRGRLRRHRAARIVARRSPTSRATTR